MSVQSWSYLSYGASAQNSSNRDRNRASEMMGYDGSMYLKKASTRSSAWCFGGRANSTSSMVPPMLQKLRKGYISGPLFGLVSPLPLVSPSMEAHEFPSTKVKLRDILCLPFVVDGDSAIDTDGCT